MCHLLIHFLILEKRDDPGSIISARHLFSGVDLLGFMKNNKYDPPNNATASQTREPALLSAELYKISTTRSMAMLASMNLPG